MPELRTSDFDYDLPKELIAQHPPADRSQSRMLVLHRKDGRIEHRTITDLKEYLSAGDVVVVNNTKVFPARVYGERLDTGGKVELLLLETIQAEERMKSAGGETFRSEWTSLCKTRGRTERGLRLRLTGASAEVEILSVSDDGCAKVFVETPEPIMEFLAKHGFPPLPPYIRRTRGDRAQAEKDAERYQTIYAKESGAVAAPTAGLHFTKGIIESLTTKGIGFGEITLHVGIGTFLPVKTDLCKDHIMHEEFFSVPQKVADFILTAKRNGGRIVAVGTTTVRALETVACGNGRITAAQGRTRLFIYPPFKFNIVDALLTNFHLPRSTLLMMVSAFCGRETLMDAYREAIKEKYRFYSYGDCMLIL